MTLPEGVQPDLSLYHLPAKGKTLVGSGEQSLVYLALKGHIPANVALMTATPCFRDEIHDATHLKTFLKLELFEHGDVSWTTAQKMRKHASECMGLLGVHTRADPQSGDLYSDDLSVELGSYYFRETPSLRWACGTGLAEPRFSRAQTVRRIHGA